MLINGQITLYEPSALVVGTRGRNLGGMQGLLPGSVSKYCLQHSPVPVIVVRPSAKRMRKKQKRQQETGRSLYSSMVEQAQQVGGRHLYDKRPVGSSVPKRATAQEAEAVAKAIGAPKRGILKPYGGPLDRVTSNKSDPMSEEDVDLQPRFALPIGFLTTESAPRADLAMQSPSIAMLQEDWDEKPTPRAKSPKPRGTSPNPQVKHERSGSDAAVSDSDDGMLGLPKIVDHRRPSVRETTPWLASILSQPEKPLRASSRNRSVSRNRSPSR